MKNDIRSFEIFPDMTIKSALYIVGDSDIRDVPNGNFPEEAQYMFNISEEPKKLIIVNKLASCFPV